MLAKITAAEGIVVIGGAIFGDINGKLRQKLVQLCGTLHNAGRIDLPAEIIDRNMRQGAVPQAGGSGAGVIIQPKEIGIAAVPAQHVGFIQLGLEVVFRDAAGDAVPQVFGIIRYKSTHMHGKTDLRLGIAQLLMNPVNKTVGTAMTLPQHLHDPQSVGHIELSGREACAQIATDSVDIRLVDSNIFIDQIAELTDSKFHQGKDCSTAFLPKKAP